MNFQYPMAGAFLLAASLVFHAGYTLAEDTENKSIQTAKYSRDGYGLSIGLGYVDMASPLYTDEQIDGFKVFIDGHYQWKGFFVEFANDPARDKNLPAVGYNFYSMDHWHLDLIAVEATGRVKFQYEVEGEVKQISSDPTVGVGLRAQGAWGDSIVQMVALPYMNKNFQSNRLVDYASLWLGYRWQVKNWSVNGLIGAVYKSGGLLDHQFGVTENAADEKMWTYHPSSGIDYTAHVELSYPVRKNILFQIYSRYTQYSDEVLGSPAVEMSRRWSNRPEKEHELGVLLNYVF